MFVCSVSQKIDLYICRLEILRYDGEGKEVNLLARGVYRLDQLVCIVSTLSFEFVHRCWPLRAVTQRTCLFRAKVMKVV